MVNIMEFNGYNDDIEVVDSIIRMVDINESNRRGHTLLMEAIMRMDDDLTIVSKILNRKDLDLEKKDKYGHTVLHIACHFNNVGAIRMLIKDRRCTPSFVNKKNLRGNTPLMETVKFGRFAIVEELGRLECVELNTKNTDGKNK